MPAPTIARVLLAVLASLLLVLATPEARSRGVLDLAARTQPVLLQNHGDYWIDTSGTHTATDVANDGSIPWQATSTALSYPVTSGHAIWIRLNVPATPNAERWYLEVPYAALNRASLYTPDGAGRWNEQRAGDLTAVSQWPVPHRHPLLPIALSAQSPTHYLLRLENGHAFNVPLRFIGEGRLSYSEQRVSLILGIFFGLIGLAALIAALSAVSLRDNAYGFYALCVALMGLTQASITGIAGLHLWPNWPRWNDISSSVLPLLTVAATLLFVAAAIALPERSRRLQLVIRGVSAAGFVSALCVGWVSAASRLTLVVPSLLVLQLSAIFALVWAWRRDDRFAPWLLLAYLPVMLAGSLTMASVSGWVAMAFLTQYGMPIAVALNLPVVMVLLMLRSQHRRENIRRIHGLDRIDPSTGLINGHVFSARLRRMIGRSERLHHQSAAMLIDIINIDQVQREFGRKTADELLLRVAERLLDTAREIDSAARLSERRFGMLVEGPFSAQEAASFGPRIVARCLMPFKAMPPDCVAQVLVVYALVPHHKVSAETLLQQLEERLAKLPVHSKRKVFLLADAHKPGTYQRAPSKGTA